MVSDVSLIQLLKWYKVHTAKAILIYTPSSKPTCHENYNAKNNYTSLSQIIFSCAVKLKYDSYSLSLSLSLSLTHTHTHTHIYIYRLLHNTTIMYYTLYYHICCQISYFLNNYYWYARIGSGLCTGNSSQFWQPTVFAFQNPNILKSNPSQKSPPVTLHYKSISISLSYMTTQDLQLF
jgi:hypothetical protein